MENLIFTATNCESNSEPSAPLFTPAEMIGNSNQPKIKVIGVGGAGGNAVSHMISQGLSGVEFIAVNTDIKALNQCRAPYRIQLGEKGTGAGTRPEAGRELALQSKEALAEIIRDTDMLFIAAGMGGGTGTGAAPVIAELAREMNILSVAVVTKPFTTEGPMKAKAAQDGIDLLERSVNSLIVVHNDKLKKELPANVKMKAALAAADNVLYNAVSGVSDIINQTGYMQVDFADVCTVMQQAGVSMMGSAMAEGDDRAVKAADMALQSPLLEGVELKDALGVLVYIAASEDSLGLEEFDVVMNKVKECAADDAVIKAGLVYDDRIGENMKVTVLITGLNRPRQAGVGMGLRPVSRHSEQLIREDARGNRIYPQSAASAGAVADWDKTTFQPFSGKAVVGNAPPISEQTPPSNTNRTIEKYAENRSVGSGLNSVAHGITAAPQVHSETRIAERSLLDMSSATKGHDASNKNHIPLPIRALTEDQAPAVIRKNATRHYHETTENSEGARKEMNNEVTHFLAGSETAQVTQGELSKMVMPRFLRRSAGGSN